MGSLNPDGSIIQRQNDTWRNIGGAITRTSQDLPNQEGTPILENSVPFPSGKTDADLVKTQYATMQLSPARKITYSPTDSLIDRQTEVLPVTASGNPEIALRPVRDYGDRHTGDKVVLGSASGDVVLDRRPNTSFRPTS